MNTILENIAGTCKHYSKYVNIAETTKHVRISTDVEACTLAKCEHCGNV